MPGGPCSPLSPAGPCNYWSKASSTVIAGSDIIIMQDRKKCMQIDKLTGGPVGPCGPTSPSFPGRPYKETKITW